MPATVGKICNDTRNLSKNSCFIAIKTERADGHDFLQQAEQNGASCAIVDHAMGSANFPQFICEDTLAGLSKIAAFTRKNFRGKVVGITGSMGKTSTKDILALLLNVQNNKTFLSENGHLGIPLTLAKFTNGESIGVLEVGIDGVGAIEGLLEISQPTDCIITGVSPIHLGNFGDENSIASEKVKMAEYVLDNSCKCILAKELLRFECFKKIAKFCIIPAEDPGAKVCFSVEQRPAGRWLNFQIEGQKCAFPIPHLMSGGMVKNLVLALAFALLSGETLANIAARLQNWRPGAMRGEISTVNGRTFFSDCYNANPAAFLDSLKNFDRLFPQGNRLFVVGSFGDLELGKCRADENIRLGQSIPVRSGDRVVIVGECGGEVQAGLLGTSPHAKGVHCLEKTEQAREFIQAHRGAVYLKGHRAYRLETLIC
jgi:UDP-N-acetylmuramoyl-tripeptide--D-alanyl-D-alanine ligase